ncbi:argininosuccinate lyase [Chelatococcus asaccharovorans]|uniref:Argininosuccinate lyase n=1 Tax=Chelatococcus asaccharovorans TaxID=28210 RepID=A0A2V3TZI2_9HYPH|nr:argininosuccinate lyase [Chelatococcus asaccharovorans]MBS7707724.1 argininosuccinate lyase [Chelatococcus asaccharovorans]PXW55301.1 argininosuccinate lyase [Chelatococcus asaccharovorans]
MMPPTSSAPHSAGSAGALLTDARLGKKPAPRLRRYYLEPGLRKELPKLHQILAVDLAHVVMLAERGIIPATQAARLVDALRDLRADPEARLRIEPERGSMVLQIEAHLTNAVGESDAGALSTGRSRIDQGATVRRLYERNGTLAVLDRLVALQDALLALAARHSRTLMPGYTHLQPSQPWVFGHYLLGFANKIHRAFVRMLEAYHHLNLSPLGTVGGSGSPWPLDRRRTAALLGFAGLVENARLGRDIQYLADIAAAACLIMNEINDLATDLQLWSSNEFALVELDAGYCGTSSIFPQKKNPIALEGIRTAAAQSMHWFSNVLALCRGMGSGDLAMRSPGHVDAVFETTADMTDLMTGIIETLIVHPSRMGARAQLGWTTASSLADLLVHQGTLSYRQAHHAVGAFVRHCVENDVAVTDATAGLFASVTGLDMALTDAEFRSALDPATFIAACTSQGGAAPEQVDALLRAAAADREADRSWLDTEQHRLASCNAELDRAAEILAAARPAGSHHHPDLAHE